MKLTFWGVRGSTPTPGANHLGYGGNTSCLEVRPEAGGLLIFDAGSGLRPLGRALQQAYGDQPIEGDIFLTHFHWDHIHGIPFFEPLWDAANTFTFFASAPTEATMEMLHLQMSPPFFPVPFEMIPATCRAVCLEASPVVRGAATVHFFPLPHPQGALGYRVECDGRALVYATDAELGSPLDAELRARAAGADVLVCDAQFTPAEYETHRGWGHSTWENVAELARDAGVGRLFLFHHDPDRDDDALDAIVGQARQIFPRTEAAREGLTLRV